MPLIGHKIVMDQPIEKVGAPSSQTLFNKLTMADEAKNGLVVVHQVRVDVLLTDLQTVNYQRANRRSLRVAIKDKELKQS